MQGLQYIGYIFFQGQGFEILEAGVSGLPLSPNYRGLYKGLLWGLYGVYVGVLRA